MPGLVPGIHDYHLHGIKDVDGRDKPGHDDLVKASGFVEFYRNNGKRSDHYGTTG
jgi:N-acetylglucosamine-6-phosphate deacetylase